MEAASAWALKSSSSTCLPLTLRVRFRICCCFGIQEGDRSARAAAEWYRLTNKERKRFCEEVDAAKAKWEADRRKEVEEQPRQLRLDIARARDEQC